MKKIGLVVNPIAGMGGRVGLKGTDGKEILERAKALGAKKEAILKASLALKQFAELKDEFLLYGADGEMGGESAHMAHLDLKTVYTSPFRETSSEDTKKLVHTLIKEGVDLIIFAGGDGTARDIYESVGLSLPVLGVPAGCKIHSPVYGRSPENAGKLVREWLEGIPLELVDKEVIDIEEEAFRKDRIETAVYGYLKVPNDSRYLQNLKSSTPQSDRQAQESAALRLIDEMEKDVFYIIGSGTTPNAIMEELALPYTMLGVDIVYNKALIAKDVNEAGILEQIKGRKARLVITPMGGQGYIIGRGNQQISYKVLSQLAKEDLIIMATQGKLNSLKNSPLLIYSGNEEIDHLFEGYYRVIVSYDKFALKKLARP